MFEVIKKGTIARLIVAAVAFSALLAVRMDDVKAALAFNTKIDKEGTLYIMGQNDTKVDDAPWLAYDKDKIKKVVFVDITTLEGELFKDCTNLCEVDFISNKTETYAGHPAKTVKSISGNTFAGCTNLKEITFPASLESGKAASAGVGPLSGSGVTKVTFAEGTEKIAAHICEGCDTLTEIVIPSGVKEIGMYAFANCKNLTAVNLPSTVEKIREYSFKQDLGLTQITIPNSVVTIDGCINGPFDGCTNLTTVSFQDGLKEVPAYLFHGCYWIKKVNWPAGLTSIGAYAFYNAKELKVGSLPDTVTAVKTKAFWMAKDTSFVVKKNMTVFSAPFGSLKEITFEEGVKKIPDSACEGANYLKTINYPQSVTEIGVASFSASAITSIIIPGTVTTIGKDAFRLCKNVRDVYIPTSVKKIGDGAFEALSLNESDVRRKEVIIRGDSNSLAKSIADKYGYTYKNAKNVETEKTDSKLKKNSYITVNNVRYKITNAATNGTGTVAIVGFSKKSLKKVTISKVVKVGNTPLKVTAINANACKGMSKLKKIIVKATTIKTVGKKAFKGLPKKVKIKVPKSKLKKYKKLFKKGGLSKKAKVSK